MMHVAFRRPERLVEYFVQVGLQEPLIPLLKEPDRPITDICVIYDRDETPPGYEKLEFTVSGGSGNLCAGGNVFSSAVWLCVTRAPHPIGPLTDLTIVWLDRDDGGKIPAGYELLEGDLNKGSYGYNIALCYTRTRMTGSHTGAILDIGIVNLTAHDSVPPRYREVGPGKRRNVNAGSFRDEMVLVVKHAIRDPLQVKYKPTIIDRYPRSEIPGSPMPGSIALFCCPEGISLEPSAHGPPPATFASFVLTTDQSVELYCACLTFYESFQADIPEVLEEEEEKEQEELAKKRKAQHAAAAAASTNPAASASFSTAPHTRIRSNSSSAADLPSGHLLYAPRKLCLLSYWPYFCNFCTWLEELYRHSRSTSRLPLESLFKQFFHATPLPGSGRMKVQLELGLSAQGTGASSLFSGAYTSHLYSALRGGINSGSGATRLVTFQRPNPDDFPISNIPLTLLFRTLSLANVLILLSAVLQEKKVILISKVTPLLTYISETIRTLLFPVKWMHPYIPVLPTPLALMLDAPMSIFVGVSEEFISSRVLSGEDVVLVYLDSDEIRIGGNTRSAYSTKSETHKAVNAHVAAAAASGTAGSGSGGGGRDPSSASHQSTHSTITSAQGHHLNHSYTTPNLSALATMQSGSFEPSDHVPDKIPHLTLLPRKLMLRLVSELRQHTNVMRLRKFRGTEEMKEYFQCFHGTTQAEVIEPELHVDLQGDSDFLPSSASFTPAGNLLAIRACFLHLFLDLLSGMEQYLRVPDVARSSSASAQQQFSQAQLFDSKSWIEAQSKSSKFGGGSQMKSFLKAWIQTQMFSYYIEERIDCNDPSRAMELAFFSHIQKYDFTLRANLESAKKNQSILVRESTPQLGVVMYLSQLGSNYTTYIVPPPSVSSEGASSVSSSPSRGVKELIYSYAEFPRRLDESLVKPLVGERGIPEASSSTGAGSGTASSSVPVMSNGNGLTVSTTTSASVAPSTSTSTSTSSTPRTSGPPSSPFARRTLSDEELEGLVLYTPIKQRTEMQYPNVPPATTTTTQHTKSVSVDSGGGGGRSSMPAPPAASGPSVSSTSMPLPSAPSTPARPLAHQKSLSHGSGAQAMSQTSVPQGSQQQQQHILRPGQSSGSISATTNPGQPGSRMFTGSRGPTVGTFRPGVNGQTQPMPPQRAGSNGSLSNGPLPSQPPPPEKKESTFTSFLNFLTEVKQRAPPTPQRAPSASGGQGQSAPSTPQRGGGGGTPQRLAPGSAQRAPPSAQRVGSVTQTQTAPRPSVQQAYLNGVATPPQRAAAPGSAIQRASSLPRQSESPMRQPNFAAAVGYIPPAQRRMLEEQRVRGSSQSFDAAASQMNLMQSMQAVGRLSFNPLPQPQLQPLPKQPQPSSSDNVHHDPGFSPDKIVSDNVTAPAGAWRG